MQSRVPRPLPAWVVRALPWAYLTGAAALIPWDLYLAFTLPQDYRTSHYRGTWVAFDTVLAIALASVGWCALKRSPKVIVAAAISSALLFTDAWFDVSSAHGIDDHLQALSAAVFLEIPGGIICLRLAYRVLQRVLITGASIDKPPSPEVEVDPDSETPAPIASP